MEEQTKPSIPSRSKKNLRGILAETIQTLMLIVAIYTLINLALPRYMVEGRSMQPVFNGEGSERVMVNRMEYFVSDPQRGDIIVLENPNDNSEYFIKRILGLPNEVITMQDGQVYADGVLIEEPYIVDLCHSARCTDKEWILGENEYFVLGDNRNASHDSTAFGPIDRSLIVGRAWLHYWPPAEWKIFQHFNYNEAIPAP